MAFLSISPDGNTIQVEDCYDQKKVLGDAGALWDPINRVWQAVFTISNLEYLMDHLDKVGVHSNVEEHVKRQAEKEEHLDKLREWSKADQQVRLKVPGFKMSLYNYQRLGTMYSITNGAGVLLADEMGLGKTLQAIATAVFLKSKGLASNALIVTPASLKFNWPLEIEKFTDEPYVVIDSKKPDDRIAQWLRNDVFFTVVNYELLLEDLFGGRKLKAKKGETADQIARRKKRMATAEKRQRILGDVRRRTWDFMAIDEAQAIKSHNSARTKNVKLLKAKFRMALTGTPMDGRLEELHSIMDYVMPGLLGSKTRFFQKHVETDFFGRVTGYKRMSEVSEKIQPFFIRRLKKDVLQDLPDKIYQNRMVVLSPKERKIYDELADHGHEATEDVDAIVALIRCKQFCNWPVQVDEDCKVSSKMDSFKEILEEVVQMNGHKMLVFSQYKTQVNILVDVFDDMGLKYLRIDGDTPKLRRAEMQNEFNTDKSIDLMVGTDAMSAGLNFTAADYVVNYDDRWSPMVMAQREDRCHRIGQRNVVNVVNFICRDTIEERIRGVIYAKNKVTAQVLGDETDDMILKRLGPKDMAKLL
jgi:SNF2 family DNA or RNA helicase